MKPDAVAQIHRDICTSAGCPHLSELNFKDPCAQCPQGHWGRYAQTDCDDPNRVPPENVIADYGLPSAPSRPGDLLAYLIEKITGGRSSCGPCDTRRKQMNTWGWWGCWRNRQVIIDWLGTEAQQAGHVITEQQLFSLFRAAIKEFRRKPEA